MSFVAYDLTFLIICCLAFGIFLYKNKHNLKRQGLLYLYPTKVGIKFIDSFTKKYNKLLRSSEYVIIACGYILMISMIWMIISFSYTYISSPFLAAALKIPVLTPLIPYLPSLFHLNFLPEFYFTYWIIIIALIAIPHEFAHGIYARLNKIKVHSTGFGFLGPFLAAFVEPDEKKMQKSSTKAQLSVLAAGTFANVLITIIGAIFLWLFFVLVFTPAGIAFNSYAISPVNISEVSAINGVSTLDMSDFLFSTNTSFLNVSANNKTYFVEPAALSYAISNKLPYLAAYDNSPAFNAKLSGSIISVGGKSTKSYSDLKDALSSYSPNDQVTITTRADNGSISSKEIVLSDKDGKAFLGVGVLPVQSRSGPMGWLYNIISKIKDPTLTYDSRMGDLGWFIYNLLWWSVIISLSVALVNMLPVGIFDGGRFFYLTVLAITSNKKLSQRLFSASTWLFIALVVLLMIKWVFAIFF